MICDINILRLALSSIETRHSHLILFFQEWPAKSLEICKKLSKTDHSNVSIEPVTKYSIQKQHACQIGHLLCFPTFLTRDGMFVSLLCLSLKLLMAFWAEYFEYYYYRYNSIDHIVIIFTISTTTNIPNHYYCSFPVSCRLVGLVGRLVGWSVGLSLFSKSSRSYTFVLLSEHIF